MHANLTEDESRVVIEKMDSDPTKPFSPEDRKTLSDAQKKLNEAMLSRSSSYQRFLVYQGMSPTAAAQHARHRYGF